MQQEITHWHVYRTVDYKYPRDCDKKVCATITEAETAICEFAKGLASNEMVRSCIEVSRCVLPDCLNKEASHEARTD